MKLCLGSLAVLFAVAGIGAVGFGDSTTVPATAPAPATATAPAVVFTQASPPDQPLVTGVHPVKLVKTDGKWQLLRDDKPYFIKGVGGDHDRDALIALGGNSVRIWGIDHKETPAELNNAAKKDLTVALGYWVQHKKKLDYNDAAAVQAQLEEFKKCVAIYKDAPAVLLWAIGNEMENPDNDNPKLWGAVEDMAKAAHQLDPNHPTMTVVAECGGNKIANIHQYCPDIDIVGINSYAGGQNVGDRYMQQAPKGANKPFVITEFGPPGQWEYWMKSSFGTLKEMMSTEKANTWYRGTYEKTVLGHPNDCLGSYAFLWGNKNEATSTWYGMFLPDSTTKTAAVDVLQEEWSGKKTDTPCPVMKKMSIQGSDVTTAGGTIKASVQAEDPNGGKLTYDWVLLGELPTLDTEEPGAVSAPSFPDAVQKNGEAEVSVKMPKVPGIYRLYGYVRNEKGGGAVCSLPIKVN